MKLRKQMAKGVILTDPGSVWFGTVVILTRPFQWVHQCATSLTASWFVGELSSKPLDYALRNTGPFTEIMKQKTTTE